MPVQIRPATTDDVSDLARLFVELKDVHVAVLPQIYRSDAATPHLEEHLRHVLDDPSHYHFVAVVAGEVVGYLSCKLNQTPDHPVVVPRCVLHIDTVVVCRAQQQRGFGEALMRHVFAWAAAQGIANVELMVAAFNAPAIALYEKLGFSTVWLRMWHSLAFADEAATDSDREARRI